MELEILYVIQGWHREWLTPIMLFFTTIGNHGFLWIVLSVMLVLFPKTRKCGLTMMAAMALTHLLGTVLLKDLIARPRPFTIDTNVTLLIPVPGGYSFPSGHASNGFAAAVSIFLYYQREGILAIIVASIIAFSRMYFFVHYPTDIIGGILLGTLDALLVNALIQKWNKRKKEKWEN